ncbi:MAG: hypothetical protein R3D45_00740 [Rhizobiaceae bacterium]
MNNAIWLITAVPQWFVATVTTPFAQGFVSAVPAFGVYFLAIGIVLGLFSRRLGLLTFLIPLGLSVALIAAAGYMRGRIYDTTFLEPGMLAFVCVQALLAVYLAYRVEGGRLPGTALAGFSVAHALFVSDIATMSLTNNWA